MRDDFLRREGLLAARGDCIIRSPRRICPPSFPSIDRAHRSLRHRQQSRRRADGGRHRSPVPAAVQAARRRLRGVGDDGVESAAARHRRSRSGAPIIAARSSRSPCRSPAPIRRMMADAARYNVDRGAQIIDINMGCPAKKVCNVAAGSALLRDEPLVAAILVRSWRAVDVPVTLKIRTGWSPDATQRARDRAHRRGRGDRGAGGARPHPRLRLRRRGRVRHHSRGEGRGVDSGDRQRRHRHAGGARRQVLARTGADALMIGRAAQGRPWIFREIRHFLDYGVLLPPPDGGGGPGADPRASRRPLRVLRRRGRRARRAQAPRLVHPGAPRRPAPAAGGQRRADDGRAGRRGAALFRQPRRSTASASTTGRRRRRWSTRARASAHDKNRYGAGRPWPREKNPTHQRQQRDRHDGREVARRVFPRPRRGEARTASTTW